MHLKDVTSVSISLSLNRFQSGPATELTGSSKKKLKSIAIFLGVSYKIVKLHVLP